jgi:hypothetical protein
VSETPETHEAVERWRQGKINMFDEMARMERERDEARKLLAAAKESLNAIHVEVGGWIAAMMKEGK